MMELFLTLLAMASVGALGFAFYTLKYNGPDSMPTLAEGEAAQRKMLQEIEDEQTNLTVVS